MSKCSHKTTILLFKKYMIQQLHNMLRFNSFTKKMVLAVWKSWPAKNKEYQKFNKIYNIVSNFTIKYIPLTLLSNFLPNC